MTALDDVGREPVWMQSFRADPEVRPLADRHYNRQKIGATQFVPPGRCLVFKTLCRRAAWVTSWPHAQYVKHAWAGAWINSLFRNEAAATASGLIIEAVGATRTFWHQPPPLGIVSFVDPRHVPGVRRRGQTIYGYCYLMAGWRHVGFTKAGLWVWQQLPDEMPDSAPVRAMEAA